MTTDWKKNSFNVSVGFLLFSRTTTNECFFKDSNLTWEQPRVINWSWIQATFSDIVHVPAVEAYVLLPLFEPPAVYKIPEKQNFWWRQWQIYETWWIWWQIIVSPEHLWLYKGLFGHLLCLRYLVRTVRYQEWQLVCRQCTQSQSLSPNPEHYVTTNSLVISRYSNSKLVWLNLIPSKNLL